MSFLDYWQSKRLGPRGHFCCPDLQFPFLGGALLMKCRLHVAVASGQAVGVVIAAKQHDGGDLTCPASVSRFASSIGCAPASRSTS